MIKVHIDPVHTNGRDVFGNVGDLHAFKATLYKTNNKYGIDNGRVVKLEIFGRFRLQYLAIYDKKWIKKPSKADLFFYEQVLKVLNQYKLISK
ncbi:MAG: hypothetical protein N4A71_20680 [Carboxylicivirga sp.]|jgi:hypothetical protein|nr:hypothetical protein [Carboxylicivirga sp.]MCT4645764.1 hypothetical protein [Carboxylicivirga sp.]